MYGLAPSFLGWTSRRMTNLRTYTHLVNIHSSDSVLCVFAEGWRRSYERTHIIFLAETEKAAELGSTLGTETLGVHDVGDAGDIGIALLDDAESED